MEGLGVGRTADNLGPCSYFPSLISHTSIDDDSFRMVVLWMD